MTRKLIKAKGPGFFLLQLAQKFFRLFRVVPEIRRVGSLLELANLVLLSVEVKDASLTLLCDLSDLLFDR